jgi:DNA-binding NarL/FixJ family response regulator
LKEIGRKNGKKHEDTVTRIATSQTERTAERAPLGQAYWLITKNVNGRMEVLTLDRDGKEMLPVFSHKEEAEMFLRLGGMGEDWRISATEAEELVSVLYGASAGVKEVALDPLPEIVGEKTVRLVSLRRERFAGQSPVRVMLADDQTMFREGLAELLISRGGMDVVGQTNTGLVCVALAQKTRPDVVILQVESVIEKSKENLSELLRISPQPKVIIVGVVVDLRAVRDLMELGASAYLLKSSSVGQLIGAIHTATLDPSGKNTIVALPRQTLERAVTASGGVLSSRQLEVLVLVARGFSNRQIAVSLHLSVGTVKRHLVNIYAKLKVGSRGEAANKALSEGWITLSDIAWHEERRR